MLKFKNYRIFYRCPSPFAESIRDLRLRLFIGGNQFLII